MVASVVPPTVIHEVRTDLDAWEKREKKISMPAMVSFQRGLHLFAHQNIREVWQSLMEGQQAVGERLEDQVPPTGAMSHRRAHLGVAPCANSVHGWSIRWRPLLPQEPLLSPFVWWLVMEPWMRCRTRLPPGRCFPHREVSTAVGSLTCVVLCSGHIAPMPFLTCTSPPSMKENKGKPSSCWNARSPLTLLRWDRGFRDGDLARRKDAPVLGRLPHGQRTHPWATRSDGTSTALPHRRGPVMTVRVIASTLPGLPQAPEGRVSRRALHGLVPRTGGHRARSGCVQQSPSRGLHTRAQGPAPGVEHGRSSPVLSHFLVRSVMHLASLAENLDPDRLRFPHTVQVLRRAVSRFSRALLSQLPLRCFHLLQDLREERVPERRWRLQPRLRTPTRSPFPSTPAGPAPTTILPTPFRSSIHVLRISAVLGAIAVGTDRSEEAVALRRGGGRTGRSHTREADKPHTSTSQAA
jgi:hypothetical protein